MFTFLVLINSCSAKYTNRQQRYSIPVPAEWNLLRENLDSSVVDYVMRFINVDEADVVLYDSTVFSEPPFIAVFSYNRYVNISKISDDPEIERNFLSEVTRKFGNGFIKSKGSYSAGKRVHVSYYEFAFFFNGNDYIYHVSFLSGSIASTQSIYFIAKENQSESVRNDLSYIIQKYRRF